VIAGFGAGDDFGEVVSELFGDAGCDATNNTAEYTALFFGLRNIVAYLLEGTKRGLSAVTVCGDAELDIRQMRGEYAVDNPRLQCFRARVQGIDAKLRAGGFPVRYIHIPRERNAAADALATRGLGQPGRKYDQPEIVMFYPSRGMYSLVSFGGEAPATPATNDAGTAGGGGYHLIDAQTVLRHPSLGAAALRSLNDTHPIEVCVGNGGRLVVLGALPSLSLRFELDATPGRGRTSNGSLEALSNVLVVDHLPVPFHLTVKEGGGFPREAVRYQLDGHTARFDAAGFPPEFRDRPFWVSGGTFLPFFSS
jgi:ribonuclease HI